MVAPSSILQAELLGLRWRDIDLAGGGASIIQAMHKLLGGRIVFEEPKSAKGKRRVALSPTAVLALRAHQERAEEDRA